MIKILFICHGNICRSPMAEFIFKKLVNDKGLSNEFEICSAATSTEEIGSGIYYPAKECLKKHNIPFDQHRSRQINKTDLEYFDYIVAMEEYNIRNLNRLLGESNKYSLLLDYTDKPGGIDDPWYTGDFEIAYEQIEEGCFGLISKILKEKFNK